MLDVVGLSKVYGSAKGSTQAIQRLDFTIEESEFVSVVGPSGCGKTTLLKCISGLMRPSSGRATLNGREILEPPSELAIVFQDYGRSLFPWLTVQKNVFLPLRRNRRARESRQAVAEALAAVSLESFADHYPWQLSGGMQQRVAIARALAYRPSLLLLDEPFASVDAQTRSELEDLVLRVRQDFGVTVLLVTHDIDEAVYMSDRIIVLSRQPSMVIDTLLVDLPRPRDQIATKALPTFLDLRGRVYHDIMRAHDETTLPGAEPAVAVTESAPRNRNGGASETRSTRRES